MHEYRSRFAIALLLGAQLLLPPSVRADENPIDSERLEAMEQRLQALEDQLAASQATVEAQRELLTRSSPEVGQGGLDAFFSTLEFGGHVTASYAYNFNNPDFNDVGGPGGQPFFQFNRSHNTFALDAVKLELGRTPTDPGSAGFQIDLLYGENAGALNGSLVTNALSVGAAFDRAAGTREPADQAIHLQEGYVSYNYEGVILKLGKFETLLGYEVLDSPYNPNVTHGWLYTYAIPLFHTGLLASGNLNETVSWSLGLVNGFNNSFDFNDNKGVLGSIGLGDEQLAVKLNAFVGAERSRCSVDLDPTCTTLFKGDDNRPMQIYDLVATARPLEGLDLWLNVDYGFEELDSSTATPAPGHPDVEDPEWKGVALGARWALSERTSLAVRGEWFRDDGGSRLYGIGTTPAPGIPFGEEIDVTSATLTLAHRLTDNLTTRLEYRHDTIDGEGSDGAFDSSTFPKSNGKFDDQQDVGILEVFYTFD